MTNQEIADLMYEVLDKYRKEQETEDLYQLKVKDDYARDNLLRIEGAEMILSRIVNRLDIKPEEQPKETPSKSVEFTIR